MIKIPDVIRDIISGSSFLQFGLSHRLLNLSQLAESIKPLVETRAKKDVQKSTLLMNLSRIQRQYQKTMPRLADHRIDNLTISANLCILSYAKSRQTHDKISRFYDQVQKDNAYITVTEGTREITLIVDNRYSDQLEAAINEQPIYKNTTISAIGVSFDEAYVQAPGFIYYVVQQLTLQGINIIEISSTYTQLILYVNQQDTKLAFETIYSRFETRRKDDLLF